MVEKKITKVDLLDEIASSIPLEKKEIQSVVNSFLENLKKSLSSGATVELRGFGTFEIRKRKGRANARNPKTGEKVPPVKPHNIVAFKAGQELAKNVWDLNTGE